MQLPGEFSPKVIFCLVVGGFTPPYTLNGPTTKKNTFFMCVFPNLMCFVFLVILKAYGKCVKENASFVTS